MKASLIKSIYERGIIYFTEIASDKSKVNIPFFWFKIWVPSRSDLPIKVTSYLLSDFIMPDGDFWWQNFEVFTAKFFIFKYFLVFLKNVKKKQMFQEFFKL